MAVAKGINTANVDNGSCEYNDCFGQCGGLAEIDDCGQCNLPDYMNFYMDDCGVCFGNNQDMDDCGVCYGSNTCLGCTDETAMNYDVTATIDDNTCLYPGCTYQLGFNYDETANFDDGSCIFILGDMNNDFVLDVIDVILSVESILNAD